MANDIFGELIEWWCEKHKYKKIIQNSEIILPLALRELTIIDNNERLISTDVKVNWYQDSEQTFMTLGEVNVENDYRTRTVLIAAYAVITPSMINLEDQANSWSETINLLKEAGVLIPKWYLNWKATIFTYFPPHSLMEFLSSFTFMKSDIKDLALSLFNTLCGLASLSIMPLDLLYMLRTDAFNVYYCGLGYEVGTQTGLSREHLMREFENELLGKLPKYFMDEYNNISKL